MLSGLIHAGEVVDLRIEEIRLDGGTQPRVGIDSATVRDYEEDMLEGASFPPVDVMYDGTQYWLWDGFHRVSAARRIGQETIPARVLQGTQADAQWASYGVNKAHGLRRTQADKRRQIEAALRHPQGSSQSNSAIARHCGVSDKTVEEVRRALVATSEIRSETKRTGLDGRIMQTAGIGARLPQTPLPEHAIARLWVAIKDAVPAVDVQQRYDWLTSREPSWFAEQFAWKVTLAEKAYEAVRKELATQIIRKALPAKPTERVATQHGDDPVHGEAVAMARAAMLQELPANATVQHQMVWLESHYPAWFQGKFFWRWPVAQKARNTLLNELHQEVANSLATERPLPAWAAEPALPAASETPAVTSIGGTPVDAPLTVTMADAVRGIQQRHAAQMPLIAEQYLRSLLAQSGKRRLSVMVDVKGGFALDAFNGGYPMTNGQPTLPAAVDEMLANVAKFAAYSRAAPAAPALPAWDQGWDDEDEGEWRIVGARCTWTVDEFTRPRVVLRKLAEQTDPDLVNCLQKRYQQLTT